MWPEILTNTSTQDLACTHHDPECCNLPISTAIYKSGFEISQPNRANLISALILGNGFSLCHHPRNCCLRLSAAIRTCRVKVWGFSWKAVRVATAGNGPVSLSWSFRSGASFVTSWSSWRGWGGPAWFSSSFAESRENQSLSWVEIFFQTTLIDTSNLFKNQ